MSCWFPFERRKKHAHVIIDSFSGSMRLPLYKQVNRDHCGLLKLAWQKNWMDLERRCVTHPEETFRVTSNSNRTALHLATFNVPCPLEVAQALLTANRHMIVVQDQNCYTPLHNVCFFQHGDDLVALFCDTASMVQQELMGRGELPTPSGTSPLFLAAKRAAPMGTLQVLLETRRRVSWIAPSTGGEPYGDTTTLDHYSSPLEILLRGRTTSLFTNLETEPNKPLRKLLRSTAVSQLARFHNVDMTKTNNNYDDDDSDELTESISETTDFDAVCLWQKCILLLAEHCPLLVHQDDKTLSFGFLHAVACCKVPVPALLQSILHIFPEQVLQRDDTGNLPLHHVLAAHHPYATKTLLDILLQQSPACSNMTLPNGQTPLVQALFQHLSWDILQALLEAGEYAALQIPYDGLYPFGIAASHDYDVDVIYSFLIKSPQVLQNFKFVAPE